MASSQQTTAASMALSCAWCSKVLEGPAKCSSCRVACYCNKECQRAHHPIHKRPCKAVKKAREERDLQERELRLAEDGDGPGESIFETDAGHFWGLHETRPYMRAKAAYANELEGIDTWQARDAALSELMGCLRLCYGDNLGSRYLVPGLMLHLDRDQECYDFIKWWQTLRDDYDYSSDGLSLHMSSTRGDALEDPTFITNKFHPLYFLAAMTLVKLNMLLSVEALESLGVLPGKLPEVLVRLTQDKVTLSSALGPDPMARIEQHGGLGEVKKTLEKQVRELARATENNNKHFWKGLRNPSSLLDLPPPQFTMHGSVEDAYGAFRTLYPAFKNVKGAIERIQVFLE